MSADGEPLESVMLGQPFGLRLEFEVLRPLEEGVVELGSVGRRRDPRGDGAEHRPGRAGAGARAGDLDRRATIDTTLLPGDFTVDVGFHRRSGLTWDYVEQVLTFVALNVAAEGDDRYPWNVVRGFVRAPTEWTVRAADPATQSAGMNALPQRGRVLYVGQAYYNAWYLSRALRKLGWKADVLNWDASPAAQTLLPRRGLPVSPTAAAGTVLPPAALLPVGAPQLRHLPLQQRARASASGTRCTTGPRAASPRAPRSGC